MQCSCKKSTMLMCLECADAVCYDCSNIIEDGSLLCFECFEELIDGGYIKEVEE